MPSLDLNQIREFSVPVEKQNNKKREHKCTCREWKGKGKRAHLPLISLQMNNKMCLRACK